MGEGFISRRGGVDASDATAAASDILSGKTAYIDDSGDAKTGTMLNRGAVSTSLNAGSVYTIPTGYHNGSGKITANSLSSQTSGTATASQILSGKTAWVNGTKITGTIPSKGSATIIPNTTNQTIAPGQYLSGTQTIQGDANLVSKNIRSGTSIFGVQGTLGGFISHTQAASLSNKKRYITSGSNTDYAIFAGGANTNGNLNSVDAYSIFLTKSTPSSLSIARNSAISANAGDYILIAGGVADWYSNVVDAYKYSLVRLTPTTLNTEKTSFVAASLNGNAIFAGGYNGSILDSVECYSPSLTRSTLSPLRVARHNLAGATISNYAIFAGGQTNTGVVNTADAYNGELVKTGITSLYNSRKHIRGACVQDYALFAGGCDANENTLNMVETYSRVLVHGNAGFSLKDSRSHADGITFKGKAIFSQGSNSNTIDIYNSDLIRENFMLDEGQSYAAISTVGNYILLAGGWTGDYTDMVSVIEYIQ